MLLKPCISRCSAANTNCRRVKRVKRVAKTVHFQVFCNKAVAGSSSAELMASFCDNLLKKVCFDVSMTASLFTNFSLLTGSVPH